ncbi:ABC transporter substrate-binding protein [Hymenobacter sp. HMF4947]|uniref:ABC transporter substrate-binding protein n=1 Tax=Hymenobacter ginkgonis TaxID=2682976 RepID=A0A7K1TAD3_9BACT|nr:tetratricopeptide repeat protein [Hymenobacter ginkgonis]MVN75349.1 ABC transporter substrate-binding protein [Hymenobacter ginkgonis]
MTHFYRAAPSWRRLLLLPLALLSLTAAAQGQLTRYRTGKTQLDQGHYAVAMKELEPLAQPINHFAQAPDAAYLYAVAATRLGQWAEAEQMLNLIRNQYPTYPNSNDVLYLQGQVSFEQGDYDTALRTLGQLPAGQLTAEREAIQAFYLAKLKDRATWQRLQKRYPQSKLVGRLYADFLLSNSSSDADRQQLDALVTQFKLDRNHYAPALAAAAAPKALARKATYNIGVLLPFELQDNSWQTQRKNQFVTDLYAGLRLAQDSLQRAGHPVQLFAYDTGADTLTLKNVLALPELAGMDLLVGPVYKSGAKLLARYAREHQIICVNPLSQDADLLTDNPYHYLYAPSAATQGRLAAQFAASAFGLGRPAVLLHEDAKDDNDFAAAYQAAYEAGGGHLLANKAFRPDDPTAFATALMGVDLATASHLVVASDNRRAGPAAFSALSAVPAATRPALLVPGAWLDNTSLEPSQLGGANVYYYHPKYFDRQQLGYRRFRQLYLAKQNLPPSVFASQGFELLLFFGNALQQYGPAFQSGLAAAPPLPGAIFEGLAYPGGAHDNQVVPLLKLSNLEPQLVR